MSATNYRQFVDETLQLTRSLVIKNQASVIGINQELRMLGRVVEDDPTTWKYYKNLAGLYHETDEIMVITSLDTQQEIEFKPGNLDRHVLTRQNYKPGTTFYNQLVTRFPNQELLIRGIVSPIPMSRSINADDYSVIDYDETLIESNETNVIEQLDKRVREFGLRWHNPAYSETDELYSSASLAVLFHQIPLWIFNIRLENCKTRFAHSYHIREYLRSNGALGKYFDYLTKAQMLFLYRNIKYIEIHAGKQETFEWLVDRLLTERGIGLAEYQLHHNLSGLPEALRGEPEFRRRALNIYHRSTRSEEHTLEELLVKERPLGQRNEEVERETIVDDSKKIVQSRRGNFPTKALESAVVDRSETGVITRSRFLFHYWAYWSSIGHYRSSVEVIHPRSGVTVRLPSDHAFLLYLYAYNKSNHQTLTVIPNVLAQAIIRNPSPSFETLRDMSQRQYFSDEEVASLVDLDGTINEDPPLSPGQFSEQVSELFRKFNRDRRWFGVREHMTARAQAEQMILHLYMDTMTDFDDAGTTYDEWFVKNSYPFQDLQPDEFGILANDLLTESLGVNLINDFDIRDVQNAMIELMTQLSSYSIQYIQEINSGSIIDWGRCPVRLGKIAQTSKELIPMRVGSNIVLETNDFRKRVIQLELKNVVKANPKLKQRATVAYNPQVTFSSDTSRRTTIRMPLHRPRFDVVEKQNPI